jgi:hypothetical protein
MRKPDHFTSHKIIDPKLVRDLARASARLKAVKAHAEKAGVKLDAIKDDAEAAALAGVELPDLAALKPVELTACVDFATGVVSFKLD